MQISRVGVDLAKNVFHVHGVDRKEEAVWRGKLSREKWLNMVMEKLQPGAEVGMEACAGSYHWARQLERFSGEADGPAVCEAIREEQQERCE